MQHNPNVDSAAQSNGSKTSHGGWRERMLDSLVLRGGRMTKWKGQAASCAPHVAGPSTSLSAALRGGFLPFALLAGLAVGPAMAADMYWDVNGGNTGSGGTGTWNTTDAFWNLSSDGVAGPFRAWNNASQDTAIFAGTAGTVTLGGAITAGGLTFSVANYTLTGGTLTLAGASPIITNNGALTIASSIAGTSGFTKTGAGTLSLTGTNSFTGDVILNAGGLSAANSAALGNIANKIVTTGSASLSIGSGAADRTVSMGSGTTLTLSGSTTGSALYTGEGGVSLNNGVTMNNDANTYTGATRFNGANNAVGVVYFSSVRNLGEASALGAPTTVANGTITFAGGSQYSDRIIYTGTGDTSNRNWVMGGSTARRLGNNGTGTLIITGDIATTQQTSFESGTAGFELLGVISGSGAISFSASAAGPITVGGANTYTGTTNISGGVVSASVLADTGTASSFGVAETINISSAGTLRYTGTGDTSNRVFSNNGATAILNDGTGGLTLSGELAFDPASPTTDSLTLGGTYSGTNVYSGVISGAGNLVSNGSGTWELSGANTRTGSITVESGTLRAGSAEALGTDVAVTVNGGTLDLNGFDLGATSLSGTGGSIALGSADLSVELKSGVSNTYAGNITGSGNLTKMGAGTLTLTGANTYTGDTTIGGGTLALDFSASGAPANDIIASASSLSMAGGKLVVTGAAGAANSQTFDGLTITGGSNTVSATSSSGGSLTINLGAISHTGGLVDFGVPTDGNITTTNTTLGGWATVNGTDYAKVESGNIVAFTEADYTDKDDASTWQSGEYITDEDGFFSTVGSTVQLSGLRYTVAKATTVTVASGATLGTDGTIIVAPSVGANNQIITGGSITGTSGGGTLGIQQNSTGNFTIASQIIDNGGPIGFTKAGTGQVILTNNANSYTGGTTISGGTLTVSDIGNGGEASGIGASAADSANLVIEGSTLKYTGTTDTSDRGFTVGRSGAVTSGTIEVATASTNLTFTGVVAGTDDAGLTKTGPGTLTLTNANSSYTGVTTVNGGGTLAVEVLTNGGTNSSIGAATSDSANIVLQNGGTLDYIGDTASTDRGVTLGTAGGKIGVSDAATELTVSGVVVGTQLTKTGDGTLILSGTNTYTGATIVSDGTLQAGSNMAFGSQSSEMRVESGALLDLDGFNNTVGVLTGAGDVDLGSATLTSSGVSGTFSGTISGTGGVTRTGGYTQTFLGANNDYTGATTINNSTLSVDSLADGGQASGIGASSSASGNLVLISSGNSNAQLTYTGGSVAIDRGFTVQNGTGIINVSNAATTLEFEGDVVGSGGVRKRGAGTLVLSGTNAYTGGTYVEAGILRVDADNALGPVASAGALGFDNTAGAALELEGHDAAVSYLYGGGTNGGDIDLGDATLTIRAGNSTTTVIYSGTITGTGDLVKNGSAIQRLHGCDSDYTGGTTINGGSIEAMCLTDGGANSSIGASSADASNLVLNGGTLRYVGADTSTNREFTLGTSGGGLDASGTGVVNFTSAAPITLTGTNTARTLTLTGTNTGDNTLAAEITNNGTGATSLTKTSTGTWVLTNPDSTYTGKTTISGGVLAIDKLSDGGEASSIGASSNAAANLVIGNGSTLRYTGSGDTTDRLFTLATGVTFIESSGTGAVVFENTAPVTFSGSGARTVGLGGTNTDLNTLGGTIGDGNGGVTTLAKNGTGTWVLTGNNSYSGNTVINDGNLMIGNGGTTGNAGVGNVIVDSPTSTLSLNRSDTFTFAGTLSGPGTLAQIGSGTSILTAAGSEIGAASVSAGTLQVDGDLTTATLAMNGASTLAVNGTVEASGETPVALTGDAGASTVQVNSGGTLRASGDLGDGSDRLVLAGLLDTGSSSLSLGAGNDTFTLNDGASISGKVEGGTGTDLLQANNANLLTLNGARVDGFESLQKLNTGTLVLTGDHAYSDGTTITGGTLQVGNGGTSGSLDSDVANNGTLAFNRSNTYTFDGLISGTGSVAQIGNGTTILTGTNSYTGPTDVQAGTLLVSGDQSGATGLTTVASGATLGGTGTIGGSVVVADGGTLSPGMAAGLAGTLTINGDLELSATSALTVNFGEANVVGGALNDLIEVAGDLTLDGTLNVSQTDGGNFGPGIYRVISYQGNLTDNGVNLGTLDYTLQTSVANQVNLVNNAQYFWDGAAGPQDDGVVNGGDGTWSLAPNPYWTDASGDTNARYGNGAFAVFMGTAGNVDVSNVNGDVEAAGMQFASDGYVISGDTLTLVGGIDDPSASIIRVGDGTSAGATMTATINAVLAGSSTLVKNDFGTLVLGGSNTYSGGTRINTGTVSVSADDNLGAASGNLTLDGGTLQNTGAFDTVRAVALGANGGTFQTDADLTVSGTVAGAGSLTKTGAETLTLSGNNTYQGGTTVKAGTVSVSADNNLGDAAGDLTLDGGTLQNTAAFASARAVEVESGGGTLQTDANLTLSGDIAGAGALTKSGSATLILTGEGTYDGGTTIADGTLQLGDGGASGSITGDVANEGALVFNRSDIYTFAGLISGSGEVEQIGDGTTILTGDNAYEGETVVSAGTLLVNGDQTAATGLTSVATGAALGGTGIIGGDVDVANGGVIRPGGLDNIPGTLTINGALELSDSSQLAYNFGQAGVVGGAYNDLMTVGDDLVLDGVLNVTETAGGSFNPGVYRIISYAGSLTDNGLALGSMPSGEFYVQTSIGGQVNLVNSTGLTLNFWDGPDGTANDGVIHGGDGVWSRVGDDWTTDTGIVNAPYANGSYAVFGGEAGTVTVSNGDGAVEVLGMQFMTDGYKITGDELALTGGTSIIRVGDGTLLGAGMTATIDATLTGASKLVKADLGTLVLEGQNSYLGGTEIEDGVLQISSDANLGDASGGLSFSGGVLRTTSDISSSRLVTLAGNGTVSTDGGTTLTLSGLVSGAGGLVKDGSGTLLLEGDNAYAGATVVAAGTLLVSGDQTAATGLTSVSSGAALGGTGTLGGDVAVADGGRLTPGLAGGTAGTLAVVGSLSLSSGSVLDYNFGQAGVVGGSLNDLVTVGGDLVLDGVLNVSETAGGSFGPGVYRVISYAGSLTDNGLTLGAVPSGDYRVQTAIAGQVNLINATGLTLNFWDGQNGTANDGVIQGGDGLWSRAADEYWTTDTGDINAPYANASFAVFGGAAGTVTVSNGDGAVEASGMQFMTDGYRITGDALTLTGGASTIRVGDSTAAGASMMATIDAVLAGDSQLVKSDLGTLVLNGQNTYGGGTAIEGGTVRIASDAALGAASGGLTLDGGTLHTTATLASTRGVTLAGAGAFKVDAATVLTLSGDIEGAGGFTKQGTGTLLLSGALSYAGATDVEEGVLRAGAANALSSASAFSLASGTELDLAGFSQTVASLSNAGTLRLSGEGVAGTVLTVAGDYAGDGGTVLINTVLGDDNSRTDRLVISGGTSGSSTLRVSNVGGTGAPTVEGIKIVDVGGASDGSFQLAGDYVFEGDQAVVTGAYAYRLYKGGVSTPQDGDWYLRSSLTDPADPQNPDDGNGGSGSSDPQPLYQPGVPVYEAYAGALQAFNQPGTLQQRMGNRSWGNGLGGNGPEGNGLEGSTASDAASGLGLWGRVEASGGSYSPETSTSGTDYDTSIWKLQAGTDFLLSEQKSGRLTGSLSAHYGTIVSRIDSAHGHGRIESKGYGVDGALTWYGDNGLYADAQAHVTWYDSDLLSATAGRALTRGNDGLGYAASLEAGQKIALGDAWSVTPQAQLSWSSVDYDDFTDPFGADVALDRSESLVGRLGVTVSHRAEWRDAAGLTNRSHIYGIGNIYYDFADGSRVVVGGTPFTGENAALWGGLGLGGTVDFADGKYSFYGEAQARTSLEQFGDSKVLNGTAGFRMRW